MRARLTLALAASLVTPSLVVTPSFATAAPAAARVAIDASKSGTPI